MILQIPNIKALGNNKISTAKTIRLIFFIVLFSLVSCTNNDITKDKYYEAENLWIQGKYEKAKQKLEDFIDLYPTSDFYDDAVFKLGEIHFLNLSEYEKAIAYFFPIAYSNKKSDFKYYANMYLADIYENYLYDYDHAIIEYQRLINNYKEQNNDKFQLNIAYCYFKKGDYKQSIVEFDNIISQYNSSKYIDQVYFQKANINYILGNCTSAVKGYNQTLLKFPKSKYAFESKIAIAECYDNEGKLNEALNILEKLQDSYNNKELLDIKIQGLKKRISKK